MPLSQNSCSSGMAVSWVIFQCPSCSTTMIGGGQALTDPNIQAVNKGNVITPPINPDEAATLDHQLQVGCWSR